LRLPLDRRDHPHPANLRWHRETVFGQVSVSGPSPWDQVLSAVRASARSIAPS
jgi:hypothetical protein